jgi:hypothetical protein
MARNIYCMKILVKNAKIFGNCLKRAQNPNSQNIDLYKFELIFHNVFESLLQAIKDFWLLESQM